MSNRDGSLFWSFIVGLALCAAIVGASVGVLWLVSLWWPL
jgi:hypothetical protein